MSKTGREVKIVILNSPETSYIIVVFRSRQHALAFKDTLTLYGVKCSVISTPKELSLGCGLSVRFDAWNKEKVSKIIFENNINSNGMYSITIKNNVMKYIKIS